MIQNKLFKTFKLLLGKGRAFNLTEPNISSISKAFLKPLEDLTRIFHKIAYTPFPSENTYNSSNNKQDELKQDIVNFEQQFNIESNNKTTLLERAKNIEAQFGLVGGQSFEYLQNNLINAGLDVRVVENIPVQNLLSQNIIQYGINEYNGEYSIYGKSGYLMIGNGILQIKEYNEITNVYEIVNKDPVQVDNTTESLSHLFLIEKRNGGTINITSGQLDILIDLILKIKPADQVALVNVTII
jgi:hypothetical protein